MTDDDTTRNGDAPDLDREWQELAGSTPAPREDARGGAHFTGADRPAYWNAQPDSGGLEPGEWGPDMPRMNRSGSNAGRGPRDWNAPVEPDAHFDGVDPDVAAFYNQPPAPSHPLAAWMWAGALASAVFAFVFWFGWLPGGGLGVGLAFVCMIAFAAVGVFLTAPRDDRVDPTDDGTRL